MRLKRYWIAAGLFLLLAAGAAAVLTDKGNTVQAARETVKEFCLVTLNLVYDKKKWWALNGQWWILDPPPLRVSKQVMVEYYKLELKWYVDYKKEIGELPKHQQDAYDRKSGIFSIPEKPSMTPGATIPSGHQVQPCQRKTNPVATA